MSDKIKKLITECKSTLDNLDCTYYGKDEITIDKKLEEDEYSGVEYIERQFADIRDSLDIISLDFQQALVIGRKG